MKEYATEQIRNVVFLGHSGTGKSTLAEALLFRQKNIDRMGRTDDGNLTSDYDPEEIKRKISINAALLPVESKALKINVLDCPGSRDFIGEILSCLRVAEGALVFVDAASGVQVGTELAMEWVEEKDLPAAVFVNKMDKENADFGKICDALTQMFGKKAVALTMPIGKEASLAGVVDIVRMKAYEEKTGKTSAVPDDLKSEAESLREQIVEAAAEGDDSLMEKFFEEGALSDEEVARGLKSAFIERRFLPVFCGAAASGIGVAPLLDFLESSFPSPLEMPGLAAFEGEETKMHPIQPDGPFSAFIFKTLSDDFAGRLSFFKVISGTLSSGVVVRNATHSKDEKVSHVLVARGKKQEEVAHIRAGDIGVLAKLNVTVTNDTLTEAKSSVKFAPTVFPQRPSLVALKAKSSTDEEKISIGLHALMEQDPTLRLERDPETRQTLLSGMGEQHLDVAVCRLRAKAKVEVELIPPKVRYRETITRKAEGMYRHKKQSGGRGQFAEVHMRLSPLQEGDYEFKWSVFGGAIPTNYQSAIDKGFQSAMEKGVLAGYRTVGVLADCFDGKYHAVDSSDMAFQIASSMAFKQVALQAGPIILEPISKVSTMVPESNMGDVMGDISQRRGKILGTESKGSKVIVSAVVPEAEMMTYAQNLRSMTGGRGSFERAFSHYEPAPHEIQAKIIEEAKKEKEEES